MVYAFLGGGGPILRRVLLADTPFFDLVYLVLLGRAVEGRRVAKV
jgi:hypothetical protein